MGRSDNPEIAGTQGVDGRNCFAVVPYSADCNTMLLLHLDGTAKNAGWLCHDVIAEGAVWSDDAVIGQALRCAGGTRLSTLALTNISAGFTVEAWLRLERPDAGGPMLLAAQHRVFEVGILADYGVAARPYMRIWTDAGSFTCRTESFLPYGCWFHIAFIYNPAAGNPQEQLSILVHGQPARFPRDSSIRDHPHGHLLQDGDELRLAENYYGRIDELRVSRCPRPAGEIIAPWLSGRAGDYVPYVPDLVLPPSPARNALRIIAVQTVPTFNSIGLYARYVSTGFTDGTCRVRYRPAGTTEWRSGMELTHDRRHREFRGSLLMLADDTAYEIELSAIAKNDLSEPPPQPARINARTWPEDVPITEERFLPAGVSAVPLVINARGRADAWIRYRPLVGAASEIAVGLDVPEAVCIENSAYVVFENVVVRGGRTSAIRVSNSHNVRVRRCELTAWGPVGRQGPRGFPVDEDGARINNVPAVNLLRACRQVVVEDCFIHAPNASAGSWRYGHPVGPQGFYLGLDGSYNNVIRNNEIIGGENGWMNDAIEGRGNQFVHGGPYRDTDIYGNFIAFANDNAVELDGGQINVRFWHNRMEAICRSISFSPNLAGPSYVFLNLDVNQGAEYFHAGSAFKVGSVHPDPGWSYIFHNTIVGAAGGGLSDQQYDDLKRGFRAVLRNNIMARTGWFSAADKPCRKFLGLDAPVFLAPERGDYRLAPDSPGRGAAVPTPWISDAGLDGICDQGAFRLGVDDSVAFPPRAAGIEIRPQSVYIRHVAGMPPVQPFALEILAPATAGARWHARSTESWLRCTPEIGVTGDMSQVVHVQIDSAALTRPGLRRAAIVLRTDAGFNRAVMCFVETACANPDLFFIEAESGTYSQSFVPAPDDEASSKKVLRVQSADYKPGSPCLTLPFNLPTPGRYFIWMRYRQPPGNTRSGVFEVTINGKQQVQTIVAERENGWLWAMLAHPVSLKCDAEMEDGSREFDPRAFRLVAGPNYLDFTPRLAGVELDFIALTECPLPPVRIAHSAPR